MLSQVHPDAHHRRAILSVPVRDLGSNDAECGAGEGLGAHFSVEHHRVAKRQKCLTNPPEGIRTLEIVGACGSVGGDASERNLDRHIHHEEHVGLRCKCPAFRQDPVPVDASFTLIRHRREVTPILNDDRASGERRANDLGHVGPAVGVEQSELLVRRDPVSAPAGEGPNPLAEGSVRRFSSLDDPPSIGGQGRRQVAGQRGLPAPVDALDDDQKTRHDRREPRSTRDDQRYAETAMSTRKAGLRAIPSGPGRANTRRSDLRSPRVAVGGLVLGLSLTPASGELGATPPRAQDEPPPVEIIVSTGAVDGPVVGAVPRPTWERVRLELRVKNRLARQIRDLEVELMLMSSPGPSAKRAIPGWSFQQKFSETIIAPRSEIDLRIARPLPARRTSPPSDEIAYVVRVVGYRIKPPDLDTAIDLLGSPRHAEQRAALRSFDDAAAATLSRSERTLLRDELALAVNTFVPVPEASDALRMLMAIRAVGSLRLSALLPAVLGLPERLDRAAWGRAMIELGNRMIGASKPGDPRLRVLPTWAREQSALLTVRAEDALIDAVRDAILQMGDQAVPDLLLLARRAPSATARRRAQSVLQRLGRATVRSQLQLRDTEAKVRVIRAFGKLGAAEAVPALIELLQDPETVVSLATRQALQEIGPAAVPGLVGALGEPDDRRVLAVLESLGPAARPALEAQAAAYGVAFGQRGRVTAGTAAIIGRLRSTRRRLKRAERIQTIERALEVGGTGEFSAAFAKLDQVFALDRELYMGFAPAIGRMYHARAKRLYVSGNYDAAVRTLNAGLSVHASEAGRDLLADAQLALVYGFIELDDLEQAEDLLAQVDPDRRHEQQLRLKSEILAARARKAMVAREYSLARTLVDRARSVYPGVSHLGLHRQLLLVENFAVLLVMALLVPAFFGAGALMIRSRWQRARLLRRARALDGADPKN